MKLDARSVGSFLGAPAAYRAVLLYGPDEGLIRERRVLIAARVAGDNPLGVTELSSEQILGESSLLHEARAALSLLGDPPPVLVRQAGDRLTTILAEALREGGNFLIVTAGELPKSSSLRGLFEKEPHLAALACYADEAQTVEQVARGFFRKHGIHASAEVLAYLRTHLGDNRAVTLSELEKIRLYLGEETEIDAETVSRLVGDNKTPGQEAMAHAALERNPRDAARLAAALLQEGEAPIMLLRSLSRQVERLMQVKAAMAKGVPVDKALATLRPPVFFKERDRLKRLSLRLGLPELEAMLVRLLAAERSAKRGADGGLVLENAVIAISRAV